MAGNDRSPPNHAAFHDSGPDADQAARLDRAPMDDGTMADGAIVANDRIIVPADMDQGVILDARTPTNRDLATLATDDGTRAKAAVVGQTTLPKMRAVGSM